MNESQWKERERKAENRAWGPLCERDLLLGQANVPLT